MTKQYDSDLTDDRKVNKYKLDEAWEQQAELSYKWGKKYAEICKDRDCLKLDIDTIMKSELDKIAAELDMEIRGDAESNNFKMSEPQIKAAILQEDRYQTKLKEIQSKQRELIDLEEEVRVYDAAKWAMQDRKKALEYESELWIAGYYGDPKQPQGPEQYKTDQQLRERYKNRREGGKDDK